MDKNDFKNSGLILEFINKIYTLKSLDEILDLIVDTIKEVVRCERISILLVDKKEKNFILKKFDGISDSEDAGVEFNNTIPIDDSMAGQVYKSGEPMLMNDMEKYGFSMQYSNYKSFMIVPLLVTDSSGNKIRVGVINLTNKKDDMPFVEDDLNIVNYICSNATLAIKNKL